MIGSAGRTSTGSHAGSGRGGGTTSGKAGAPSSMSGGAGQGGTHELEHPNLLGTGELGVCNADGWCWQNPAPAGDVFFALSDDGRYAAGENGIVFQWPDRYLPAANSNPVEFVQSSRDTVWMGGYGLWRYDGTAWTEEFGDSLQALSVASSGEVWALSNGTVRHRHDDAWIVEAPTADTALALVDLIALDDETIWVLATSYLQPKMTTKGALTLFEFKGGSWSERASTVADTGNGWGFERAGSKVYVHARGGGSGVYSPADAWSLVLNQPIGGDYGLIPTLGGALLAYGSNGLYALNDQGSEKVSDISCRKVVSIAADRALCAVSSGGLSVIRPSAPVASAPTAQLSAGLFGQVPTPIWAAAYVAWGSGPNDVWRAPLEHFDGTAWTSHSDEAPTDFRASLIDGSGPDNVWFVDQAEVLRYDGAAFHVVPLPDVSRTEPVFISSVRTLAADDTWMVHGTANSMKILHFDGAAWTETLKLEDGSYAYARSAFAGGGSAPLLVGAGPKLYRRDGDTWQTLATLADGYSVIDLAVDGSDVWALSQGAVYQLVDGDFVNRGIYSAGLEHIALTEGYVWHYHGTHARTLARLK